MKYREEREGDKIGTIQLKDKTKTFNFLFNNNYLELEDAFCHTDEMYQEAIKFYEMKFAENEKVEKN